MIDLWRSAADADACAERWDRDPVSQAFMALLDGDRFEGRFRDGAHATDVSDLMRRMVKESLVTFDMKPLFPERIA